MSKFIEKNFGDSVPPDANLRLLVEEPNRRYGTVQIVHEKTPVSTSTSLDAGTSPLYADTPPPRILTLTRIRRSRLFLGSGFAAAALAVVLVVDNLSSGSDSPPASITSSINPTDTASPTEDPVSSAARVAREAEQSRADASYYASVSSAEANDPCNGIDKYLGDPRVSEAKNRREAAKVAEANGVSLDCTMEELPFAYSADPCRRVEWHDWAWRPENWGDPKYGFGKDARKEATAFSKRDLAPGVHC